MTAAEAGQYDSFTVAELNDFRAAASRVLIERRYIAQSRGRLVAGVRAGFAASWAYALSLAVIALIVKLAGSDVLTVLRDLFAK